MNLGVFLQTVGRPVAYFPSLTPITGGVTGALFLCQFIYWAGKGRDDNGWIYKTQGEITQETGLTRREQETARRNLKAKGLLEEQYVRLRHQMLYRVNRKTLAELWERTFPNGGNVHSGEALSAIRPLYTETTTENTLSIRQSVLRRKEPFVGNASELCSLFETDEVATLLKTYPDVDLGLEAAACVDWHKEKGKPMLRPKTAFRNWLKNTNRFGATNEPASISPPGYPRKKLEYHYEDPLVRDKDGRPLPLVPR